MNIKILDSWLRDYLETKASAEIIAEKLSLTSASVERVEKYNDDFLYDIEITTNRPDLFSVIGLAKEAAAILPQFGIKAEFKNMQIDLDKSTLTPDLKIINDPKLVNRVIAVSMEVKLGNSNEEIKTRLEASGIRSLNNVIDITNYVMRVIGHPTHVFDYDRLNTKTLTIREAKAGEQIQTLDNRIYSLKGEEIIAVNDQSEIVDLLGIMGLNNSVVTNETKKILFFIDNNDPMHMRKASMELGIRTEAASLNEKGIDSETAMEACIYGISLFKKYAGAKNISSIIDIYPNKVKQKSVKVKLSSIKKVIGIDIDIKKIIPALKTLGFETNLDHVYLTAKVPFNRVNDVEIAEDVIEEIARIYGYHNLPSIIPPINKEVIPFKLSGQFYWEEKIKLAMKYLGFTETYTYSFVSENMFEGPVDEAIEVLNPLTLDFLYMRNSLIPSLLEVSKLNKQTSELKIFEISNVYLKNINELPTEKMMFSGLIKKEGVNFYQVKGLIEQVLVDLGIRNIIFKPSINSQSASSLYIKNDYLGEIEILDSGLIDFELNLEIILKHATNAKTFKNFPKFPPISEDISIIVDENFTTKEIIEIIKAQDKLISTVNLTETYEDTRTFHLEYQNLEKNLTKEDAGKIHSKIESILKDKFNALIK